MSAIFKTSRDEDLYIVWSTICDAPMAIGSHEAVERWLYRHNEPRVAERLARAETTGTSFVDGEYGWDDDGIVLREFPTADTRSRWLPRANFHGFAAAVLAGEDFSHLVEAIVLGGDEEGRGEEARRVLAALPVPVDEEECPPEVGFHRREALRRLEEGR